MVQEEWVRDFPDGMYDVATLTHDIGEGYFVDMGCMLWNRYYKSYGWAKKYLEKCGYEKIGTLVTVEGVDKARVSGIKAKHHLVSKERGRYGRTI